MYKFKKLFGAVFLLLTMTYLILLLTYGISIGSQLQIDNKKMEDYLKNVGQCDVINATILSIFGYSCSKPNCGKCINDCEAPEIIKADEYKCILVSIYNENKMVYRVPLDGCLSIINFDKVTKYINPFDDQEYQLILVFSSCIWLIILMCYIFCLNNRNI